MKQFFSLIVVNVILIICYDFGFVKDFFIQDINAGLKDEMENPEQLVSILFNTKLQVVFISYLLIH